MESAITSPRGLLFALGAAVLVVGVSATEAGPYLPAFLLALCYCLWSFPRPVVAVVTIVLLHAYVFEQTSDITILELAIGVYLYSYLGYWFAMKLFVARERIVSSAVEGLLITFLLICYASVVMIIAGGSRVDTWFRECLTLSTLLLSFPAREAMRTQKGLVAVCAAFGLLVGSLAIVNIVQYRASTLAANYFWEITSGRKPFGSAFYSSLAIGAFSLHAHLKNGRARLLALFLAILGSMALATTFYRGFWIAAVLGVTALFFMTRNVERRRLLWTCVTGVALVTVVVFLFLGDLGSTVFQAVWGRLVSSGSAMADISIANRLAESRSVLTLVAESPIVGHGVGVWFSHFNIITRTTQVLMYVHNAYVYLLLKVGVVGLVVFGGYFLLALRNGIRISRSGAVTPFGLAMVRATVAIFLGLVFVATNSGILQDKQVLLVIALGTAVIASQRKG